MSRMFRIEAPTRLPNARLFELHRKCADRTATPAELDELELMCAALEAGQDIHPKTEGDGATA